MSPVLEKGWMLAVAQFRTLKPVSMDGAVLRLGFRFVNKNKTCIHSQQQA